MINDPLAGIEFRRNAVEPVECLKAGWELIKSQYWLFVGITAVGFIIGSVVPLGILMGPMMSGIYLALFQTRRGRPIEFGILFKGFDYFGESVVATLLHMIPILVIFVPSYIIFYIGLFLVMPRQGSEPDPRALLGFFGLFAIFWLVMMVILIVVSVVFTFAYPLIVDRRLSGLNAVKLSIKAALANFWRLLGLLLLSGLLNFVGVLFCYVGVIFVLPIGFAAISRAYEQVFGLAGEIAPNLPPPPPIFS
ncbi:MAG: hypothetical protein M3R69_13300 [Acidobacteriota bacterium]|nr:hypothetical protein [Acidobacteriota bacterium]